MRQKTLRAVLWIAASSMLLGGCASTQPSATTVTPPTLGEELPRYVADALRPVLQEPSTELSLRDALGLALLHSPELAMYSWEIRAREAEALQAGLRPNPTITAEFENFGGTGVASGYGGTESTLALSQLIQLGGKRSKKLELGSLKRDLAAWDYEEKRIDVLTATSKAYAAVVAWQEQLSLADELIAVADSIRQAVSARVLAGATSPVEERRASVSLETSRIDRQRTARALEAARAQLAANWGGDHPSFASASGNLENLQPLPELSYLSSQVGANPELARWVTELSRRQAERDVARSMGIPDLDVAAGIRHFSETGHYGVVAGISVPIPVFDRNQGAVTASEARLVLAEHAQRSAETHVRTALQVSYADASASFDEAQALSNRALPEAEATFTLAEAAYRRGRLRLTDVLDAQRTLFQLRGRQVDALLRYHTTVADLERLTGMPIFPPIDNQR